MGLAREGLHDARPRDVLLHKRRDVGHARLDHPRDREQDLAHRAADEVDAGDGGDGDQREQRVDRDHHAEGDEEREHRDAHHRRHVQEHQHRADVGVGARDQLSGLHAVEERERERRQVAIEDRAQLVLQALVELAHVVHLDPADHAGQDCEAAQLPEVGRQRLRLLAERDVERLLGDPGDGDAHHGRGERREETDRGQPLVGQQDREHAPEPPLAGIGVDRGARRSVGVSHR